MMFALTLTWNMTRTRSQSSWSWEVSCVHELKETPALEGRGSSARKQNSSRLICGLPVKVIGMSSIHSFTKCFKVGFSDNVVLNRKHAHYSFQSSDSPPLSHSRIIQKYEYVNAFEGVHSANTLMFGDFSVLMHAHIHQITKAIDARYCPFETRTRPFVVLAEFFVQNTKQIDIYSSNGDLNVDSLCLW